MGTRRTLPVIGRKVRLPLGEPRADDSDYRPLLCVWEITLKCDLACRHCGSRAGRARPDELSTEECLTLIGDLAELGVREVTLIGGEAYLRSDWTDIIRAIEERAMVAALVTGGRGMSLERARAASDAGLRFASVSIDGQAPTHDRLRGARGSYEAATTAIANLRACDVTCSVNTQVNRRSMGDLDKTLDFLAAAGVATWQLQLTVPMGRAADEEDLILQPYDLHELFPRLADLAARCWSLGIGFALGNNLGYFGPYEEQLRGAVDPRYAHGCAAGKLVIGIEADGTVKGCPSLATESWAGGNVRTQPLRSIWERASTLRYTRHRTRAEAWGYCASCYYVDECQSGCTWMADSLLGRPGNNPYCHHRVLELARVGRRERVERVGAAPGTPFDRARFRLVDEPWEVT